MNAVLVGGLTRAGNDGSCRQGLSIAFLGDYPIEPTPRPLPLLSVRDPDDIKVLAAALAAEVDVLVTGDHDLLTVEGDHPLRILAPRAFWEVVRSAAGPR